MKLFIGNLPFSSDETAIKNFFAPIAVKSVRLITDRETQKPRGFGFVELASDGDVQSALALDGEMLEGRAINIGMAKEKERAAPIRTAKTPRPVEVRHMVGGKEVEDFKQAWR